MKISLMHESLEILPSGAIHWPRHQILVASDLHLGKEASFRNAGLPIPEGAAGDDLARISKAITTLGVRTLVITGDLFHSHSGLVPVVMDTISRWRDANQDLRIVLTLGNHDLNCGPLPSFWGFEIHHHRLCLSPFVFQHEPEKSDEGYVLAGHLHPVVSISKGRKKAALRLPCFHFGKKVGILPAFGNFTGGHCVQREKDDRVFAIAGERVVEV